MGGRRRAQRQSDVAELGRRWVSRLASTHVARDRPLHSRPVSSPREPAALETVAMALAEDVQVATFVGSISGLRDNLPRQVRQNVRQLPMEWFRPRR